ncbi:MAG: LamG-like jellyroll fold domain-containing protein [Polyangiales bacterium]
MDSTDAAAVVDVAVDAAWDSADAVQGTADAAVAVDVAVDSIPDVLDSASGDAALDAAPSCGSTNCGAASFDGVNDYVMIPGAAGISTPSMTMSMWVRLRSTAVQPLLERKTRADGGSLHGFNFNQVPCPGQFGSRFYVSRCDPGTCTSANFIDLCTTDARRPGWNHLLATYDAATGRAELFLNGVLQSTGTRGSGLVTEDPLSPIGVGVDVVGNTPTSSRANADIADVTFLDHAAPRTEVNALFSGVFDRCATLANWRLNDAAGSIVHGVGAAARDGTSARSSWVVDGPTCRPSCGSTNCGAASFDGVNDYVMIPGAAGISTPSMTMSMWVRLRSTAVQPLLERKTRADGGSLHGFNFNQVPCPGQFGSRFYVSRCDPGTCTSANFIDLCTTDARRPGWNHLLATYDAATGRAELFLNGVLQSTGTRGSGLVTEDPLSPIGVGVDVVGNTPTSSRANADIADVTFLDHAAPRTEVNALFSGVFDRCATLANWRLNDAAGSIVHGVGAAARDGTSARSSWVLDGPTCS